MPKTKKIVEIASDGTKRWFKNGQFHRTDGPAIEYPTGSKQWWVNGRRVTAKEKEPSDA